MNFDLSFSPSKDLDEALVIPVFETLDFSESFQKLDVFSNGFLKKSIQTSIFKGKKDESFSTVIPIHDKMVPVLCFGLGTFKDDFSNLFWAERGSALWPLIKNQYQSIVLDFADSRISQKSIAHLVEGVSLRAFEVDCYKTKQEKKPSLQSLTVIGSSEAKDYFENLRHVIEGNILTRKLVLDPPNVLYPKTMAQKANALADLGVQVEILGEEDMKKIGMKALLGVGQGSSFESKLIILKWMGGKEDEKPIAFVGKGVTFDSGGLSIKPSSGMEEMKADMAGSATILGLFKTLALRKARVNVVGVLGMVENMPSGSAQRPSDIVVSLSGQTIEILNTDAEGRLVLADALWYTQDRFKPKCMIDLATLTGAIVVALGHEYAGLFSNDDKLSDQLIKTGDDVGEYLWRLPLNDAYDKDIDSTIADVKNIGSGRGAGSCTAAHFLKRFTNNIPWVHLDIAGVELSKTDKPLTGKGSTGFGVRLLNKWLETFYED